MSAKHIRLEVDLFERDLNQEVQKLADLCNHRGALINQFRTEISRCPTQKTSLIFKVSKSTLKRMTGKYSEQMVFEPLNEIHHYFNISNGGALFSGIYKHLLYSTKNNKVTPNKSAISAIGEGVAGYLAQKVFKCRLLARPNHDYPDAVMEANAMTYLIEAKSSMSEKSLRNELDKEMNKIVSYISAAQKRDVRQVRGVLIGTFIKSEFEYKCEVNKLTLL